MYEPLAPAKAIEVRSVTKHYRLGELQSLAASLRPGGHRPPPFKALEDVSFDVCRGECFGILGANGSGKSTVLQIISGITVPTAGEILVRGTVLPFLQVGAGFHPELTGRENVILYGTVMGLDREVIMTSIEKVAAFAEIESHLDTPNKRYSDGMQARLSFAIAIIFPAHIYLFDEVLAVVDDAFRSRCLAEIAGLVAAGRTVIFVSHDLEQIRQVCTRAAWLQEGRLITLGDTEHVAQRYAEALAVEEHA